MRIDYHTADNADDPHVVVFTVDEDGLQDTILSTFYPTTTDSPICRTEERALAFMRGWHAAKRWFVENGGQVIEQGGK